MPLVRDLQESPLVLLLAGYGYSHRGRHAFGFSRRGRRGT
jgi:hypothetical protein